MKRFSTVFSALALTAAITLVGGVAQAGTLQVPHNKQDRVIIYTQKTQFAHPVDYWWHLDPSASGSWDYFSTVQSVDQPLPLERGTIPTYGTPRPSVRQQVRREFSFSSVYGNPAVTGTPPAYQQANY